MLRPVQLLIDNINIQYKSSNILDESTRYYLRMECIPTVKYIQLVTQKNLAKMICKAFMVSSGSCINKLNKYQCVKMATRT